MQYFFAEDIESDIFTLNEEESKHCVRVLRMGVGDTLRVTDGQGTLCRCRIVEAHPKCCAVAVEERRRDPVRPFRLHVAVAPTKNSARLEWFVEKAVEMGVETITPVVCDRSERVVLKQERLQKLAVSAMKQSLKTHLPSIEPPTPLRELIASPFAGQRFVAHCDGDSRVPLREVCHAGEDVQVLIGPEGDFSPDEIHTALAAGFQPVTLGECRLRTETAALAAVAYINLIN